MIPYNTQSSYDKKFLKNVSHFCYETKSAGEWITMKDCILNLYYGMFWLEKFNRKRSLNKKVYDNIKITVIVFYKDRQLYNELKYTKTEY